MSIEEITFQLTPKFQKEAEKIFNDEEFRDLTKYLAKNPEKGDIIKGSGGFRKLRWAYGSKGKSGGSRVIYYYVNGDGVIFLITVYAKNKKDNISKDFINTLKKCKDLILQ